MSFAAKKPGETERRPEFLPEKVERGRLVDRVLDRLSQAILSGDLQPGDALASESDLAAAFDVSKPVVREALRQLGAMGVLQSAQGRATTVQRLTPEPLERFHRFAVRSTDYGMSDAVELRYALEIQCARLAAQRRKPDDLDAINNALQRMKAAFDDQPAWVQADLDFHVALARATHNSMLVYQLLALRPILEEIVTVFNARTHGPALDRSATWTRHEDLYQAVAAGDEPAAVQAMETHFDAGWSVLRSLFRQRED